MCNNRPRPHRIHLAPSHNSHPRGNGQRNLGRLTPCLVANSPESEREKEREREWWSQRSISTVAAVAGAGLFSGIVHPEREEVGTRRDREGPL